MSETNMSPESLFLKMVLLDYMFSFVNSTFKGLCCNLLFFTVLSQRGRSDSCVSHWWRWIYRITCCFEAAQGLIPCYHCGKVSFFNWEVVKLQCFGLLNLHLCLTNRTISLAGILALSRFYRVCSQNPGGFNSSMLT